MLPSGVTLQVASELCLDRIELILVAFEGFLTTAGNNICNNSHFALLSLYFMPRALLNPLYSLSHFILARILRGT